MIWSTLRSVMRDTAIEFSPALAQRHHFVRLGDGRWTRTLGNPEGCSHVRGRVWTIGGGS